MMTYKEAKQRLGKVAPLFDGMNRQTIEMAIDALEKQIPKKLTYNEMYKVEFYECPICGLEFQTQGKCNYCSNCGQALDWSDEND